MEIPVPYKVRFSAFDTWILVLTLLVFPVGGLLAFIRLASTHHHNKAKGRNLRLLGWAMVFSYISIMIILYLTYDTFGEEEQIDYLTSGIVLAIYWFLPTLIFFLVAHKLDKKFGTLLQVYQEAVVSMRLTSVEQIRSLSQTSAADVTRDLTFMFEEGLLPEGRIINGAVYIHQQAFDDYLNEEYDEEYDGEYDDEDSISDENGHGRPSGFHSPVSGQTSSPKTVECPGCGAKVFLGTDREKECEYCGNVVCA
ncbi:hypothetical protein [Paenibacillus sp. XY044]|uniref:hypothetical protein n=1 Tax=Paenibacillus sp. XY044 TaxID=2026089 RepID=UPI000B989197|nr:hypothetical protein [Paenibacillus sp. XY044]OZB96238.1 hypothetical protein CJP46_10045 [Paenibacillus sp. XY044]